MILLSIPSAIQQLVVFSSNNLICQAWQLTCHIWVGKIHGVPENGTDSDLSERHSGVCHSGGQEGDWGTQRDDPGTGYMVRRDRDTLNALMKMQGRGRWWASPQYPFFSIEIPFFKIVGFLPIPNKENTSQALLCAGVAVRGVLPTSHAASRHLLPAPAHLHLLPATELLPPDTRTQGAAPQLEGGGQYT